MIPNIDNSPASSATAGSIPGLAAAELDGHLARLFGVAERLADFAAVVAAVFAASRLYQALEPYRAARYGSPRLLFCAAGFGVLFVLLLERHGGYRPSVSLLAIRETERILRVTLQAFMVALLAAYFFAASVSRLAFGFALLAVPLFVTIEKWEMHRLLCALRSRGYAARKSVILGTGPAARRIYSALVRSPRLGIEPVAFLGTDGQNSPGEIYESSYRRSRHAKVLSAPLCPELFRQLDASVLVIAEPSVDHQSMLLTLEKTSEAGVSTYVASGDFVEPGYWVDYTELDGIMLACLSRGTTRMVYDAGKRTLDVLISGAALLLLAPLAAVIAVAIRSTSPGPVLFRQQRAGKGGRLFSIYKFRTMYQEVPQYGYSPQGTGDPRVTPIGRFLRRTSVDELPQLLNVFLGQMSLVGPRPEMPFLVEQYTPLQRQRLAVKPGMTGLWQISADRAFLIHENMEYDLFYVRHRSLFMDAAILLHTLLFAGRGV
ncbi:MAG TPA: exopolysaccharide biosynthesis polyprenyl glycosylphosphotransferase [Candidatus Binatia bacterium]|nr:exopolysaccharide biosynthesis polyprenyl glycosylphosphotransferase [Candidatus Binatia bacterium]